jgi:hypothetical protein
VNLKEKKEKISNKKSFFINLQYFLNEYIQQLIQVVEIFLLLLLHLNVFHEEVNL